jgi:transcriptional regulator with XRE-family HTH domain
MATFGEFVKKERTKKDLNQSDFGQQIGIIMTDISKIENGRKKFPFANLEKLAKFLNMDFTELKNLFVADKLVDEVRKYECSNTVYSVAEKQDKYMRSKNSKQANIKF